MGYSLEKTLTVDFLYTKGAYKMPKDCLVRPAVAGQEAAGLNQERVDLDWTQIRIFFFFKHNECAKEEAARQAVEAPPRECSRLDWMELALI